MQTPEIVAAARTNEEQRRKLANVQAVTDSDITDEGAGYARLEFRSGLGNMARFFNGGKPFVDDLELSVEDGFACIRSSSRVGDSDLGVNKKRVNFIAAALRSSGWDAPDVQ